MRVVQDSGSLMYEDLSSQSVLHHVLPTRREAIGLLNSFVAHKECAQLCPIADHDKGHFDTQTERNCGFCWCCWQEVEQFELSFCCHRTGQSSFRRLDEECEWPTKWRHDVSGLQAHLNSPKKLTKIGHVPACTVQNTLLLQFMSTHDLYRNEASSTKPLVLHSRDSEKNDNSTQPSNVSSTKCLLPQRDKLLFFCSVHHCSSELPLVANDAFRAQWLDFHVEMFNFTFFGCNFALLHTVNASQLHLTVWQVLQQCVNDKSSEKGENFFHWSCFSLKFCSWDFRFSSPPQANERLSSSSCMVHKFGCEKKTRNVIQAWRHRMPLCWLEM